MPRANQSCNGCVTTSDSGGTSRSPCYHKVFIPSTLPPVTGFLSLKMRTLLLIFACVGIGYGIAYFEFKKRTSGVKNIMGAEADMKAAIEKAKISPSKPGKIEVVGGPELDFGTMRLGTERAHKFVFRNVGNAPVQLEYKAASCKCTVGKLDLKSLQPGEETFVEMKWLAEGLLADFAQTATIATDAIDQEEIKLTIRGKIGQAHVFDPGLADFRTILSGDDNELKGKLYSFEESLIEISSTRWSDLSLNNKIACVMEDARKLEKGEVPEFAEARYCMNFTVHVKRGIPAGPFTGNMIFMKKSSDPEKPEETINFPVQGRVVSPVRVIASPDYNEDKNVLDLGTAKSDVGLKRSFVLAVKNEDAADIQLKLGRVSPEKAEKVVKVTITEAKVTAKQKMFSVTLEIPPGLPPTEFLGAYSKDFAKIVLETNMESAPQFPMYFKFRITE